jgi:hypothetical protein
MRIIGEDFVAAGKPDYILARSGIEYTDITTGIIYKQTTIPYGRNWVVVVKEQVYNGVRSDRVIGTVGPLVGGGDLSANRSISMPQANGVTNGYLSSGDWVIFSGKVPQTRTITINGVTQDLSADRSWTVGGGDSLNGFLLMGG